MIALGMMSGSSLDGIDCALVDLRARSEGYGLEILDMQTLPFPEPLDKLLHDVLIDGFADSERIARLHCALGVSFADVAIEFLQGRRVDFIASHGQTLFHDGAHATTMQIGDPFALRERLGATVCFDFRSADCALGGEGAPLVPYVDALLLGNATEKRAALNCGGIANVTLLPPGCNADRNLVSAFDTGPGNIAIDGWIAAATDRRERYDRDGAHAARGKCDRLLLERMLTNPYFAASPPKSTGRERFGESFLREHHRELAALSLDDAVATLTALTVESIARELERHGFTDADIFISGGGAHNRELLRGLRERLSSARVECSDVMGIPVDAKEAIAFAILGYETLRERAANLPSVTGASRATALGAIAPYRLRDLLARIDLEGAT
ncbi:MAG TPA: anhydro-N-acetylmuramic acid kinase [Candidatus Dormibacteraeota bacterium]|nr:anhydro-N-acetylmuramic acid kinase [Candidatus Dormibacteraeota bacterium]